MRATLNISLTEIQAARSHREHPANADAFDLILQARVWDNRPRTMDTIAEALRLYKLALEKDPNAVLALAGASGKLSDYAYYGVTPRAMLLRQSAEYLDRAVSGAKVRAMVEILLAPTRGGSIQAECDHRAREYLACRMASCRRFC